MATVDTWDWSGARWWKIDFHAHSMASFDYGMDTPQQSDLRSRSYSDWLLDFMNAGIDCVVIADHNTGAGIDPARAALAALIADPPPAYRPLTLFPGVELSVQGGVHVLAILPELATTADVDTLLGAVGYVDEKGSSDGVTTESFTKVLTAINAKGGIGIPAHVDRASGLFRLQLATLKQALRSEGLLALETADAEALAPAGISSGLLPLARVAGSDSHHPTGDPGQSYPGSRFTWVKMTSPSIDGLRLAILDGPLSLRRSDVVGSDPNLVPSLAIDRIEVTGATFIGRTAPFALTLNPWLNAIIGGRGTGKSTIVEFLRLALQRRGELPDDFAAEHAKYETVNGPGNQTGLLEPGASVNVHYRKDGTPFTIAWREDARGGAIEELGAQGWRIVPGDIASRFPVRIYSQKQIFHLARDPLALLKVIDQAPPVDRRSWEEQHAESVSGFLALRARAREIEAGLSREPRLRGELEDVRRLLALFDQTHHADVLKSYRDRLRQATVVESWESGWSASGDRVREVAKLLVPDAIPSDAFDPAATDYQALAAIETTTRTELMAVQEDLEEKAAEVDAIVGRWRTALRESTWKQMADASTAAYTDLISRLAEEGAVSPREHAGLVAKQQELEAQLVELDEQKTQAAALWAEADALLIAIQQARRELSDLRNEFLKEVLRNNKYVRIRVLRYGAVDTIEREFRQVIERPDGSFSRYIGRPSEPGGLLEPLGHDLHKPQETENALLEIKRTIRELASGKGDLAIYTDSRLLRHLEQLEPEQLDRLDIWFPEDSLSVKYSRGASGKDFVAIEQGSPGQKTAALLAFLLSYGDEPMILDQPEDDLDNHLIYELIVKQLRDTKLRRQVVVVTHNSNIVVNGDAELVVALSSQGSDTTCDCEGSLQDGTVRDLICEVMEGGREAFEQRYRRIVLASR